MRTTSDKNGLRVLPIQLPQIVEKLRIEERKEMRRVKRLSKVARPTWTPKRLAALKAKVDYSFLIPFVRNQGAYGCGMNAASACWDIMNEKACPHSPNISVNRQLWVWSRTLHEFAHGDKKDMGVTDPSGNSYKNLNDYLYNFGCPTEGTELTDSDAISWPTEAGDDECSNYKQNGLPTPVKVDVNEFKTWLDKGPLRVGVNGGMWSPGHFLAFVGYDDTKKRFKYINSWGDDWGDNGFGYMEYSKLNQEADGAEFYEFIPPKSVPTVRVKFTHSHRQDVYLWLSGGSFPTLVSTVTTSKGAVSGMGVPAAVGSGQLTQASQGKTSDMSILTKVPPMSKPKTLTRVKRIWPNGQRQDTSRNLTLTVTMPTAFVWPPAPDNPLCLYIFDGGGHSESGGDLAEFTAAFGNQIFKCGQLSNGPVHFNPHQSTKLSIP